jgi:D-alanine-D-alanine ligase
VSGAAIRTNQGISNARDFGRVVVLYGGESAEREVSLVSGQAVLEALARNGVDAHGLDASGMWLPALERGNYDRAWIALHGRGGEDGVVQAVLGVLGIPYTGSGQTGCAICMDKLQTKRILLAAGLPTPPFAEVRNVDDLRAAARDFGYPLAVKPTREGSSIGVSKVDSPDQLEAAFQFAAGYDCAVMAEPWIVGRELTSAVLQGQVLPSVGIEASSTFYDYEAKYESNDTRYVCPAGLETEVEDLLGTLASRAFETVGARGWGRVDFVIAESGEAYVLEVNTVPGMTSHSLVPMAAAQAGIDFDTLVWRILETSFAAGQPAGSEVRHAV